jgi:NAD(P)-dependent dehydrogenase (short-subunit alcohol dehydrogenase family)
MSDQTSTAGLSTALVAGGAGALGEAIAAELARRGFHVALADTDAERGERVMQRLRDAGAQADFYKLDVTEPASWIQLRDELQQDWPQLDMFVAAAGILEVNDFEKTTLERHTEVIAVNLLGTMNGCHTLIPWLKSHPSGSHIVLVASCVAFLTAPWSASYNASKAGVLALAESLTAEFAPFSIQVTTACPAFFTSDLFASARIADPALARLISKLVRNSPLTAPGLARRICDAAQRGHPYVVVPWRTYGLWWLKRLLPSICVRKIGRDGHRFRARSEAALARQQDETNPQNR